MAGRWQKGQSGNPNGRPPRGRALTELLQLAGEELVVYEGERLPGKQVMASLLWQLATTGSAKLASGRKLTVGSATWLEVIKFIYGQVDGPPPKDVNVSSEGTPITLVVGGLDPNKDI